jgi:hypothetical protein
MTINNSPFNSSFAAPIAGRNDTTVAVGRRRQARGCASLRGGPGLGGRRRKASQRSWGALTAWQDAQERGNALDYARGGWGRVDTSGDVVTAAFAGLRLKQQHQDDIPRRVHWERTSKR